MKLIEDFEAWERIEGRYIFDYGQMQFKWNGPSRKKPKKVLETEDISEDD